MQIPADFSPLAIAQDRARLVLSHQLSRFMDIAALALLLAASLLFWSWLKRRG
jgi:hypothetical protein